MGFMDFFKPQWKHSEPGVRAAAIRALEEDQQALLLTLALEDEDPGNRMIAARKIKDPELLKRLRDRSGDRSIKELAQKQWVESLVAMARSAGPDPQSLERVRTAMEDIGEDQRALEDIAKGASTLEVRKVAFAKLVHPGAWHAVALNEADNGLALEALGKVTRESQLESLSKGAHSKAVRIAAKERLKSMTASKGPDKDSVHRAKLNLLLAVGDKLAAAAEETPFGFAWDAAKAQLDETEHALSELMAEGAQPDSARLTRFREGSSKFRARYARWRHDKSEREEKEKAAAGNRLIKEDVCAQLEALWASGADASAAAANATTTNPGDSSAVAAASAEAVEAKSSESSAGSAIRALRDRFYAAGPVSDEIDAELQKRFRAVLDKLEKRTREREAAVRRSAEEKEHGEKLSALCAQAEALAAEPAGQAADRFRELRKEWSKAIAAAAQFSGKEEFRVRFENAVSSTQASLDQIRASHLERMRELLPSMEALLESADLIAAEKRFKELNGAWRGLHPAPFGPEAEALMSRYQAFLDRFREASDWLRWSNLRAKTLICDKLETLAAQEDRKAMVARFKELQAEWKSFGPVPWDSSEALWDRYHQLSDALYEKCREYFAELDEERESNLKAKEELSARIEALAAQEEIDWREAMDVVKEAQGAWKTLGAVPKAQSEAVWTRFRAACNAFFERKDKYHQANLAKKLELVAVAESLQDSTEWKTAGARIKEAQEKWKTIGPAPKDQADPIWERFHGACEKFYQARRAHIEKLEQEKPQNLARKEELIKLVEGLESLPGDQDRFEKIKEAQAAWKEVGPVPREMEDALWERFRKPIDAYFEGRKARMGEERKVREENAKIKEDICIEAESLIGSQDWKATIDKIKALQERWKTTGPAPRESDRELWRRFRAACDAFFDRLKENSARRDQEREGNLKRKIDLCFLTETWLSRALTPEEAQARAAWEAQGLPMDLARFKAKEGAVNLNAATDAVKTIQKEWKKIGPVPKDKSDAVWERFHAACDAFFEERRVALGLRPEDPQANLDKKLDLIADAENLARNPGPESARRAANLQREWRRIGPVPRAQSDYVWRRFTEACRAAGGEGPVSEGEDFSESEPEAETANP